MADKHGLHGFETFPRYQSSVLMNTFFVSV